MIHIFSSIIFILLFGSMPIPTIARRQHCYLSGYIESVYVYQEVNSTSIVVTKNFPPVSWGVTDVSTQYVRRCTCEGFEDQYCFNVSDVNMCSVDRSWQTGTLRPTYCYKLPSVYAEMLGLLWIPLLFILMIVFTMPFTTVIGRNAVEFIISPCLPCSRRRRITRMIQNEVESISRHIALEESFGRDDGMVEQTVLQLKTRTLEDTEEDNQSNNSDDENICLICTAPLDKGEKIGDLTCGHSFHADCLKEWLKRRNACPLCNAQVANSHTVLVDREEAFETNPPGEVDEDTRNRFQRLLHFYHRRSTRSMHLSMD